MSNSAVDSDVLPPPPMHQFKSPSFSLTDTIPRIQLYFRPTQLQLHYTEATGRFLTTKQAVKEGELIMSSRAYVKGVNENYRKRVCDSCWSYQHGKGYEFRCFKCNQVYFCSRECMEAALDTSGHALHHQTNNQNEPSESSDGSSTNPPSDASNREPAFSQTDSHCQILDRGYHRYECTAFKRLNGMKIDKDSAGLIKAIIRIYYKQKYSPDPIDCLIDQTAEQSPLADNPSYVLSPRAVDFQALIGHEAVPLEQLLGPNVRREDYSHSSHLLFWYELKRDLAKLMPGESLHELFSILSKLESNAFGLYAPPPADATDDELGLKVIGRSLYPTASYFNHSCSPNCQVFQTGSILSVYAMRDIEAGEETCITYIDTHMPYADRQRELEATYHFQCRCKRCLVDVEEFNQSLSEIIPLSNPDKPIIKKKKYQHKGKPKKKKIEPRYNTDQLIEQQIVEQVNGKTESTMSDDETSSEQ